MKIILIRHGIAEDKKSTIKDYDRELTLQGRKKFLKNLEKHKNELQNINKILCSPSLRTRQTCALLCSIINIPENNIIYDNTIYTFSGYESLEEIIKKHTTSEKDNICLIGHNDSISSLATHLTDNPISMKKGEIIHIMT